jgi:glycerate 2-kinase
MIKNKSSELTDIFNAALAAVDPYHAVLNAASLERNCLHIGGASYELDAYKRIIVVGAGKATSRMAMAIEKLLGARISAGLIIVKDGHKSPLDIIRQIEASHPVPNQAGVDGTQKILQMAQLAGGDTLFICLISGGASALLVAPADGVTLADKQQLTGLLLNSGAAIEELNAVRKHLSAVKGGRLAQAAFPAQIVTLILSDVIGDRLDVIASGPTAQDSSTFADAWAVIEKFRLQKKIPVHAANHLQQGMAGQVSETVKQGDACLRKTHNAIVGGISVALAAARKKSLQLGIDAEIINAVLQGEARDAARFLAQTAHATLAKMQANERRVLLSGGETTVTVRGAGMGGRNQELALAFAIECEGLQGLYLLSAGTDGSDGPNDAAGAIVNGDTAAQARKLNVDPARYLADNDSYHFFQKFDAASGEKTHLITGPTGTNVMDMQIMLLDKAE